MPNNFSTDVLDDAESSLAEIKRPKRSLDHIGPRPTRVQPKDAMLATHPVERAGVKKSKSTPRQSHETSGDSIKLCSSLPHNHSSHHNNYLRKNNNFLFEENAPPLVLDENFDDEIEQFDSKRIIRPNKHPEKARIPERIKIPPHDYRAPQNHRRVTPKMTKNMMVFNNIIRPTNLAGKSSIRGDGTNLILQNFNNSVVNFTQSSSKNVEENPQKRNHKVINIGDLKFYKEGIMKSLVSRPKAELSSLYRPNRSFGKFKGNSSFTGEEK